MRALLVTLGSHGDIHPFIAIGRALAARGHHATLATNPYFQAQIERDASDRFAFAALTERAELKDLIAEHKVMDPARGPMAVMRKLVLPMVPQFAERTRELLREFRADVLIYHPIVIGARWAAELDQIGGSRPHTVSVSPSPLMWANPDDPMVLLPHRSHQPSRAAVNFDRWLGRIFVRAMMDPGLNRIRRTLNLPAVRNNFHAECTTADLNLGIWSPLLRAPLRGDPLASTITGFCWHDRDHTQEAPDHELESFFRAGAAPIVFSLGSTGVHAAGRFFTHAVEAAQHLKQRALLVIGRDQPPPANLPADGSIKAVAYAPYSTVFPRAGVVTHHGGAGTTAQGLRSGRPTLITPMAHDQFDNAARVKRLGAGDTLRFSKVTRDTLVRKLGPLFADPAFARNAASLAPRITTEDGAARAAELVEAAIDLGSPPQPRSGETALAGGVSHR
ncbi:MAG: glycosyltransferase family 1 protein [Phycisphaerales bacterium]|nr:glycosyltransferase family 1 protein [Phycisphaerales bacterium]